MTVFECFICDNKKARFESYVEAHEWMESNGLEWFDCSIMVDYYVEPGKDLEDYPDGYEPSITELVL